MAPAPGEKEAAGTSSPGLPPRQPRWPQRQMAPRAGEETAPSLRSRCQIPSPPLIYSGQRHCGSCANPLPSATANQSAGWPRRSCLLSYFHLEARGEIVSRKERCVGVTGASPPPRQSRFGTRFLPLTARSRGEGETSVSLDNGKGQPGPAARLMSQRAFPSGGFLLG